MFVRKLVAHSQCEFVLMVAILTTVLFGLLSEPARADDPAFLAFGAGNRYWIFKPIAGGMATSDAALYGYAGVNVDLFFGRRFVLTPNFAAGYYHDGNGKDLGHSLEFRSGVEFAYRLDDRARLGLSLHHISNASLDDNNPGTEILALVYSVPLGD